MCSRFVSISYFILAIVGLSAQGSELDEAIVLKNAAKSIFRESAEKAVTPERYADGIKMLERAGDLLEIALKSDPETVEPLQREVSSARFWAQRFANVSVADALHGNKTPPVANANKTTPAPEKPPAEPAPEKPAEPAAPAISAAESAVVEAKKLDPSAAELMKQGKMAEASEKLMKSLIGKQTPDKTAQLGDYFFAQGKFRLALDYYKLLVKDSEKRFKPNDPFLALDLSKLADTYYEAGSYTQAEQLYQRILKIKEKFYGAEHPEIADALDALGNVQRALNKLDLAEASTKRSLAMREKLLKPEAPELAKSHLAIGNLLAERSKYKAAQDEFRKANEIAEKAYGPDDPRIVPYLSRLGGYLTGKDVYDEGDGLLVRALDLATKASGAEHPNAASVLVRFAWHIERQELTDTRVKEYFQKALSIYEKSFGKDSVHVAHTLNCLGVIAEREKKINIAEQYYNQALALYLKSFSDAHPDIARMSFNLGVVAERGEKWTEALPLFERAFVMYKQIYGMEKYETIDALTATGHVYLKMGKRTDAMERLNLALQVAEKSLPESIALRKRIMSNYESLLKQLNRTAEAAAMEKRRLAL